MDFFDGTALSGFEAMIWLPALALGVLVWHVGHRLRGIRCTCLGDPNDHRRYFQGKRYHRVLRAARQRSAVIATYDPYAPFDEGGTDDGGDAD